MTKYTNAKYIVSNGKSIMLCVDIDAVTSFVPLDPANTDYANIMALVAADELTIAPAGE